MKTSILALMAAMTLGAGMAQAQTAAAKVQVPVVQADYDEDDDGEEGGLLGLFGGHHGRHGGQQRGESDHEGRGGDDDGGCRQGATDANGRCQTGAQNTTPPANGLFNNGAAPKAQMN
jgi:hypothetical protein